MIKREVILLTQFKKDYKRILRSHVKKSDIVNSIEEINNCLINSIPIPSKYNDHVLKNNMKGLRECHIIGNNVLLLYKISKKSNKISFVALGSHSEIFGSKKKPKFIIPESFLSILLRNLK